MRCFAYILHGFGGGDYLVTVPLFCFERQNGEYRDYQYSNGGEPMYQRSNAALERALALDPNLASAAGQLITNRVEKGNLIQAYRDADDLVKRNPGSAAAHFTHGYVLRYAGLLDESARE